LIGKGFFAEMTEKISHSSRPAFGVLGEPRGRLLTELCGKALTAGDLAAIVGTSANAVRVHLDGLRSAGLVQYTVQRRGVGKPTHVYALTEAAEYLLSAAYAPTLSALLEVLASRLNGGLRPLLREVGDRLARSESVRPSNKAGVAAGLSLLRALGAPASVDRSGGQQTLRTACCPLGAVTKQHGELCSMLEGALSAVVGSRVTEICDRAEHPRCAFVVEDR
jgi:predicted ArsR family transcriptional regulator